MWHSAQRGEVLSCTQHEMGAWYPEPPHSSGEAGFHQRSHLLLHNFLPWRLYLRTLFPLWAGSPAWTRIKVALLGLPPELCEGVF